MDFFSKRNTLNKILLAPVWVLAAGFHATVFAGFFDMPEITETPDLKRESMLRDIDIPSVRDRDPDPEGGPRLSITEFRLQGIVEFPELDITRAEISKLVEDIRFDMMGEEKLLESGFTMDELGEVSNLLGEIENETVDRHVSSLEVQKLVWLVREQRQKRGITLGMIEIIADKITNYYRERGFILAKAYIPEQQVRDGVVTLTLLLGSLGEVVVNDSKLYSEKTLSSVFNGMLAKPITSSMIEERLYFINDYPGVTAQGFFESGSQVGDTKLNINVQSQKRYDANIRLDNHGSAQTGEYRLYAEGQLHNLLGNADQLMVGLLFAFSPNNTAYGQVRYSSKVWSPRVQLSVGASNNQFILGPGNSESVDFLEIEGETNLADVTASFILKRSRKQNYSVDLVYEGVESIVRFGILKGLDVGLDDEIRNTSLAFNFDILQEAQKILHQGQVKLTSGEFLLGVDPGQEEDYWIFSSNYTFLTFWKLPYFGSNTRIIARAQEQFTGSPLSSISQFALAGPTLTRGFPLNQFSADNGIVVSTDWIFNSPGFLNYSLGASNLKDIINPFVFVDISYGEAKSLSKGEDDSTAELADVGLGLQFSYLNKIKANLQFALPVHNSFSSETIEEKVEDSGRVVFDIQYSFR